VIFVDGLPGSGKSTTAEWIAVDLAARGLPCRLLREREADHPLNVGGDLHPSGSTTGTRMFSTYTVGSFVEESLARWRAFAAEARHSTRTHVLDSYPFQNSVRVLLQMDADLATVAAYQSQVENEVTELDPVLIYLDPGDAERSLHEIAARRGPAWTAYAVSVITDCPYASARDLRGLDGAVTLLRSYKQLLDESVGRFSFPRLALTSCEHGWPECRSRIRDFLNIYLPTRDVVP